MKEISLYNITNAFVQLINQEEMSDEEILLLNEELTNLLEQKSENIIGFVRNIELTINAMKMEEKRLSDNRKEMENKLDKFKSYVKNCMENADIPKVDTSLGTISLRKNPLSVDILDETLIPNKYKKEVITYKIDKDAIKKDFKETGELIDGVSYNTDKKSLNIR